MRTALILGVLAGLALVIYKGIYFGPWMEVMITLSSTIVIAVLICLFLRILASIGSFFVRALLILIFVALVLLGGEKLWNFINPNHPLNHQLKMPSAISNTISRISTKAN